MKCPKCLADINDNDSVCSYCGSQVNENIDDSVVSNDVPVITSIISSDDVSTISDEIPSTEVVDNTVSNDVVSPDVVANAVSNDAVSTGAVVDNTVLNDVVSSDVVANAVSNDAVSTGAVVDNTVLNDTVSTEVVDNPISNEIVSPEAVYEVVNSKVTDNNKKSPKSKLFIIIGVIVLLIIIFCLFMTFIGKSNNSSSSSKKSDNDSSLTVADKLDKKELKIKDVLDAYETYDSHPKEYDKYTVYHVSFVDYLENETNDIKISGNVITGTIKVGDELQLLRDGGDPVMLTISKIDNSYNESLNYIDSDNDYLTHIYVSNTDYTAKDLYGAKLLTTANIINNHTKVEVAIHNLTFEESKKFLYHPIYSKENERILESGDYNFLYFWDYYDGRTAVFNLKQDLNPGEEVYDAELIFRNKFPIYVGAKFLVGTGSWIYSVGIVTKIIE